MTFSKKHRLKKQVACYSKRQKSKLSQQLDHGKRMQSLFPMSDLCSLKRSSLGESSKDYGGKYWSLNLNTSAPTDPSLKSGALDIGRRYAWDRKLLVHRGRLTSILSEKHMDYIREVSDSIRLYDPTLQPKTLGTIRVVAICGAMTKSHTDAFGGLTSNYVQFHGTGAGLKVYKFPQFRCSVVLFQGRPYIPMSFSERSGLKMYGVKDDIDSTPPFVDRKKKATKYQFTASTIDSLQPYGTLKYVVAGIKQGKLQIVDANEGQRVYLTCKNLSRISIMDAFEMSSHVDNLTTQVLSRKHYKIKGKQGQWNKFEAWKYRHELLGDCWVRRTHAYFRLIRGPIKGADYQRNPRGYFETVPNEHLTQPEFNGPFIPPHIAAQYAPSFHYGQR
jgi:hypothetical protein